jgi:hypothetical protein
MQAALAFRRQVLDWDVWYVIRSNMHANPLDARMAHLEGAFGQVNERLGSIDRRLDGIDRRLDGIEVRFDAKFNRLVGLVLGTWITTILTVIFHH